jgi:hypothetical protein
VLEEIVEMEEVSSIERPFNTFHVSSTTVDKILVI